jgi:hypothetical protein
MKLRLLQAIRSKSSLVHYSINPNEIKSEIEKLGGTVTNIWNIQQYRTKLPLSMVFCGAETCSKQQGHFQHRVHTAV